MKKYDNKNNKNMKRNEQHMMTTHEKCNENFKAFVRSISSKEMKTNEEQK